MTCYVCKRKFRTNVHGRTFWGLEDDPWVCDQCILSAAISAFGGHDAKIPVWKKDQGPLLETPAP